jgi:hypothetical protein
MSDIAKRAAVVIVAAVIADETLQAQVPPPVPDAYAFLYSRNADVDAARKRLPFASISISHKGCFGNCPIYTATLNLDGSANYDGKAAVERKGQFTGLVSLSEFGQLSLLIERSGFLKLASGYGVSGTDLETVAVTVTRRNGETKMVINYGYAAPPEVWVLERAIAGAVARIRWKQATTSK